jgi:hypothetical protein
MTSAAPALAHHPFAAEYDWKKPITVTGTVTRFDWENPHSTLIVKGRDDKGTEADWMVELAGPGRLTQLGWNAYELRAGDRVSVDGWLAKSGGKQLSAKTVTVNGLQLAAGSSFFEEGKAPAATIRQVKALPATH